jgi:formylglycine-generating enzyme required for sulfatase activity
MIRITRNSAVQAAAICLLVGLYGCGGSSDATTPAPPAKVNASLVAVDGGTATIGNAAVAKAAPVHDVTVSDFYISKYAITVDEWDAYTNATGKPLWVDTNSSGRGQNPVYEISWYDAVEYCNWRSVQEGLTQVYTIDKTKIDPNNHTSATDDALKYLVTADWSANGYRLPTEAEFEYAAKGGKLTKGYTYPGSNNPNEVAWYGGKAATAATTAGGAVLANFTTGNVKNKTDLRKVGTLKANELGLYDMAGNVHVWVWDKYSTARTGQPATGYNTLTTVNPKGHTIFNKFITRGGNSGGRRSCIVPTTRFTKGAKNMCATGIRLARNK